MLKISYLISYLKDLVVLVDEGAVVKRKCRHLLETESKRKIGGGAPALYLLFK